MQQTQRKKRQNRQAIKRILLPQKVDGVKWLITRCCNSLIVPAAGPNALSSVSVEFALIQVTLITFSRILIVKERE